MDVLSVTQLDSHLVCPRIKAVVAKYGIQLWTLLVRLWIQKDWHCDYLNVATGVVVNAM